MSDKISKTTGMAATAPPLATKPVPMKFFATWEVDRTPSNCIPRLCSLTLSRLVVFRPLGTDLPSISIAVKMQSSKRTLRSNELLLPANGLLDTGLEMTFSLQYPHFLKRDGNRLHVLLQRRKRYKNRTMLGYKTLAEGIIRMDQVLQKQMDLELELMADGGNKDKQQAVAKLTVLQLNSTPVDQDKKGTGNEFSDEEDEAEFSSGEEGELSDSEPLRSKMPHTRHNLKQRFVSLLKRFRVPDTEASRAALGATLGNTSDIQALFHELESLSCDDDSTGEQDTMSISSTPKPSLRPFFSSSRSLVDSNNTPNTDSLEYKILHQLDDKTPSSSSTLVGSGETPSQDVDSLEPKKKFSLSNTIFDQESTTTRKQFMDQVTRLLTSQDSNQLPEVVALVTFPSIYEQQLNGFITRLMNIYKVVFQPANTHEVKIVFQALLNRIHKFCNSSAKPARPIKFLLIGGDFIVSTTIRHYVDILSQKPVDWQHLLRFYIVPVGVNATARHLAAIDTPYANLFPDTCWIVVGQEEMLARIQRYVNTNTNVLQMTIAEAMLTCHDEGSQIFIPFINEVRVGPSTDTSTNSITAASQSIDLDDPTSSPSTTISLTIVPSTITITSSNVSPPAQPPLTPPSSPNVQKVDLPPWEPLELQLDYWQLSTNNTTTALTSATNTSSATNIQNAVAAKCTLKGVFKNLCVSRTPTMHSAPFHITMNYTTKEKKQKIMRLGKRKEKERDTGDNSRVQTVEFVSRLICSIKTPSTSTTTSVSLTPPASMRVVIDGTDWTNVKFFQLSAAWQTHIKYFNLAGGGVISGNSAAPPLATPELS